MALLVHALLVGALTWGIAWKRDPQTPVIAAELWSALPVQAAPKEQEAPPPPPPPEPARRTDPPLPTAADIALERARKQEQERKAREEAQRKAEQKKAEQKKADDKKAAERREQERKLADDKNARKTSARTMIASARPMRKSSARRSSKQREALRDEQLRRMQGLAGATGNEQSTGSAQRSAGPSASYAGRIVARVKPNIVFTDTVSGNPETEVEVRAAPDGTIVGKRVVKSSGVKAWDEAVLRALDRTEVLPRDVDGRIPSTMILVFRPRD